MVMACVSMYCYHGNGLCFNGGPLYITMVIACISMGTPVCYHGNGLRFNGEPHGNGLCFNGGPLYVTHGNGRLVFQWGTLYVTMVMACISMGDPVCYHGNGLRFNGGAPVCYHGNGGPTDFKVHIITMW